MSDPQPEIPACAAIQFSDGVIIAGKRHDTCIRATIQWGSPRHEVANAIQGFMTTRGRFVNREEAMQLAVAADMGSASSGDGVLRGTTLFSEDLY